MLAFVFGGFFGAALSCGNLGAAGAFLLMGVVAHAVETGWRPSMSWLKK